MERQLSTDQQQHQLQFNTTIASNLPATIITPTQSRYPPTVTTQLQTIDDHQQLFTAPNDGHHHLPVSTHQSVDHQWTTTTTRPHPFHLLTAAENLYFATGVDPKVCHLHDSVADRQKLTIREPELLAKAAQAAVALVETRTANGESALLPNMISYLNEFIQSAK